MLDVNLSRNFLRACQNGDLSKVQALVSEHGVEDWTVFRHSSSGDTPLHVAAREGHLNIVQYLCENFEKPDFKVDVVNKDTKRPLHEAAQFARSDVLKYLIAKGATIDSLKRADWTPLMLACTKTGSEACECIAALLNAKANQFLKNKDGWTAMHMVCRSGDEDAFDLMLNQSIKCIDDRSNNGRSTLHIAAFNGHVNLVERLVALNSNLLNARDSSGSAPLHEAAVADHLAVVKRLVELGANRRATNNIGQSVLHMTASVGNLEILKYIVEIDGTSFNATPSLA